MGTSLKPLARVNWPDRDRALWKAARAPAELFDEGGRAAAWRPATVSSVERGNGIWLTWLQSTGQLDPTVEPIDRVTAERVQAFIKAYSKGRSDLTIATTIRGVAYCIRASCPSGDSEWLVRLAHRMAARAHPVRPKLPRMVTITDLLALGERLMSEGRRRLGVGLLGGAQMFRDGLMIAALATRPVRRRNLTGLQIGTSFTRANGRFRVSFPAEETKGSQPIDFSYPDWLTAPFDFYLRYARPILLRRSASDDDWLWIGRRGRRMGDTEISHRITILTQRHLGRPVSPQLFRDSAATDIATHDPDHVRIVRSVLGHASLRTGERYYNQATSMSAAGRYQRCINRLRGAG